MADKGKGKEKQATAAAASPSTSQSKPTSTTATTTPATATAPAATGPPMHTKGDWTAVWNADVGKYYYWNRTTNTTTWTNPFESGDTAPAATAAPSTSASPAPTAEATASTSKATSPQPGSSNTAAAQDPSASTAPADEEEGATSSGPTAAAFGGIDPDLAYLDPSLASRAKGAGGAGAYVARFNARTGKFEADPTKTPDRVSDVQRAKRQNQFYFDYDGWQATLAQQQEQNTLKRGSGDVEDEANKKHRPSKKEMEAIRMRNKEKKDKKQKGWLMN